MTNFDNILCYHILLKKGGIFIFDKFIEHFKIINKKGYIKGINNNTNSCGLTFEKLINKKPDNLFFPDYNNIEIKCTQRFSRYPINLFSLSFDGPELYENDYLLKTYGKNDHQFKEKKILITKLKFREKILIYNKCYFELNINDDKLVINIYDLNFNLIEQRGFIDFDSLKQRINLKLTNLVVVYASKKKAKNDLYFRYYKINCYKLKDFETFIKLIKSNNIEINLQLRFARSGNNIGKNKSKNITFGIKKEKLSSLFNKIYSYEK